MSHAGVQWIRARLWPEGKVTAGKLGDTCCPREVSSFILALDTNRLKIPFWFPPRWVPPAPATLGYARSCPLPPWAMLGHAPQLSTHHADLSRHKVAQSVEPFHVSLQIVGLVTETRLGKTQGPHSALLSITFGTLSQFIDHSHRSSGKCWDLKTVHKYPWFDVYPSGLFSIHSNI